MSIYNSNDPRDKAAVEFEQRRHQARQHGASRAQTHEGYYYDTYLSYRTRGCSPSYAHKMASSNVANWDKYDNYKEGDEPMGFSFDSSSYFRD